MATQPAELLNLGYLQALHVGTEAPATEKLLWYDENPTQRRHKYFDMTLGQWLPVARGSYAVTISTTDLAANPATITHNLGDPYPQVFGLTETGVRVQVAVTYLDDNRLQLTGITSSDTTLTILVRT